MADKRLNDLNTASDGAYVYAEDASGNQIKISKADLATVVAGQLGEATPSKSGLMSKYSAPLYLSSMMVIGTLYKINLANTGGACGGHIMISIAHPYYGSLTACFVPNSNSGTFSSVQINGTYRGIFKLYKGGNSLYIKKASGGADTLTLTPISYASIGIEAVTIDESTLTEI